MSIIRAPRPDSNFYLLDKQIIEDSRLSWAARGLLVYLLGKPDHWQVSVAHLRNETSGSAKPTGRDGVYALLDELIKAGYMMREQVRQDSGKLGEINYVVSEKPLPASPLPAQPYTAQPYTANPTQVSIEDKQVLKGARNTHGASAPSADPSQQVVADLQEAIDASSDTVPADADNPPPAPRVIPTKAKAAKPKVSLPEWLPADAWADFVDMRVKLRAPMTERAKSLMLRKLDDLRLLGHDPRAVIEQSIMHGWKGVFPIKGAHGGGGVSRQASIEARNRQAAEEFINGGDWQ